MTKDQAVAKIVARGVNGDVEIGGEWLTIRREGVAARLTGHQGDRPLALRDVTGVEFEEPGRITYGAIRFDLAGPHRSWWSPLGWWAPFSDGRRQESVMFRREQAGDFQAIRTHVEAFVDGRA